MCIRGARSSQGHAQKSFSTATGAIPVRPSWPTNLPSLILLLYILYFLTYFVIVYSAYV